MSDLPPDERPGAEEGPEKWPDRDDPDVADLPGDPEEPWPTRELPGHPEEPWPRTPPPPEER